MFCWFYSCQEEMRNLSGDRFGKVEKNATAAYATGPT